MKNKLILWVIAVILDAMVIRYTAAQIVEVGHLEPSFSTSFGDVWGAGDYAFLGTRGG